MMAEVPRLLALKSLRLSIAETLVTLIGIPQYVGYPMEKHEISNSEIDWISLFRHVASDQVTVEIADGAIAIAEIVPKKKPLAVKDLPALMASLPPLGHDASSFANDVEEGRKVFRLDDDPWES
jgi:hypothetical protein